MTDDTKIDEILMFGFESNDFVNDLIGKNRRIEAKAQLQQLIVDARIDELKHIENRAITHEDTGVQWTVPVWVIDDRIKELQASKEGGQDE